MKKNAMVLASILFVAAGCAHQGGPGRSGMDTGSSSSLPASNDTFSTEHVEHYPDGTIRTPAADSSVRGGTLRARGVEPYQSSRNTADPGKPENDESGVWDNYGRPDDQSGVDLNAADSVDRDDSGQGGFATFESDQASGLDNWEPAEDANWNPSDDLMRDGLSGDEAMLEGTESANAGTYPIDPEFESMSDPEMAADSEFSMEDESGVGSAAESESGTGKSSEVDDNPAPDLNTSPRLEENISGEFQLDEQSNNESESWDSAVPPQVGVTGNEPEWLFKNNRAQGVGSAAAGEFGIAASRDPLRLEIGSPDQQLEGRVKRGLLLESPITRSAMSHDVVRNIAVSAKGGVVTLKGSVPTENERKLAEIRAAEIEGVTRVDNRLIVTPAADPVHRDLGSGHDLEDRTDLLQD